MTEPNNKPYYYLKVINGKPQEDIRDFIRKYNNTIRNSDELDEASEIMVGYFDEVFRLSLTVYVLRFYPYSVDMNVNEKDTIYKKKEDALKAAIQLLKDNGYKSKVIELEQFIENIEME